jgi:hypothetical protein
MKFQVLTAISMKPNITELQYFRGTDHDTDHYLVVAQLAQRPSVSKQATSKFSMHRLI